MESNNKKPETPKRDLDDIKPIVTGPPAKKKSNLLADVLKDVVNDDLPAIGEYLLKDAITMTVGCVQQTLHSAISMLFKMDTPYRTRGGYYGDGWWNKDIKNDYGKYYRGDDHPYRPNSVPPWEETSKGPKYSNSPMRDYLDYPIRDYMQAKAVLAELRESLSYYDSVTLLEFYKLVDYKFEGGWEFNRSTLTDYGWFDLSSVTISPKGGYYVLNMPKAVYIK